MCLLTYDMVLFSGITPVFAYSNRDILFPRIPKIYTRYLVVNNQPPLSSLPPRSKQKMTLSNFELINRLLLRSVQ